MAEKILIRQALVLTMKGEEPFRGDIAVEGGKLVGVGQAPEGFTPDKVIDARGQIAMPGLINTHNHAAMTLLRGFGSDLPLQAWLETKMWPAEANMTPDDIYWGSLGAITEMIRSGVTAFADMYAEMDRVAEAVEQSGIRGVLSRGLIGNAPNGEKALVENKAFVENWHGQADGRVTCMFGPHAPYTCSPEYIQRVMAEADRLGVGIHIHLSETQFEVEQITKEYGKPPVELMESIGLFTGRHVLGAHLVWLNEKEKEILVNRQVAMAHNPESNMKLASGIAPVKELLDRGLPVSIGTDGAASNNNMEMWTAIRMTNYLQKVATLDPLAVPARQALEMATVNGAKALGLADRVGVLEVGKEADLILVDCNKVHAVPLHDPEAHLAYSVHPDDIIGVMVQGRLLMEQGKLLTIDEERVKAEVAQRGLRIIEGV